MTRMKIVIGCALLCLSCGRGDPNGGSGDNGSPHVDKLDGPLAPTPAGVIVAFGGIKPPDGWLLCDGSAVSRDQYPALHGAIGSIWGDGGDGDGPLFSLPDLRARFLRGADQGALRDPDRDSRTEIQTGGNKGALIGSLQKDATRMPTKLTTGNAGAHGDHWRGQAVNINCGGLASCSVVGGFVAGPDDVPDHAHAVSGGDKETRPENVYVHYIIKY